MRPIPSEALDYEGQGQKTGWLCPQGSPLPLPSPKAESKGGSQRGGFLRQGEWGGGTDACRGCSFFKLVQSDELQEVDLVSLHKFKEGVSSEFQS